LQCADSDLKGGNAEAAVEWLFSHPDDMAEEPGAAETTSSDDSTPTSAGSSKLPATYRLKAFVSHKGPSVHSGHYVAHVRKGNGHGGGDDPEWVLFNDEKVVKADGGAQNAGDLMAFAYIYIFERVETLEASA
jgi:ubiquitin carboxyl-terminal hydrolase 5/13